MPPPCLRRCQELGKLKASLQKRFVTSCTFLLKEMNDLYDSIEVGRIGLNVTYKLDERCPFDHAMTTVVLHYGPCVEASSRNAGFNVRTACCKLPSLVAGSAVRSTARASASPFCTASKRGERPCLSFSDTSA